MKVLFPLLFVFLILASPSFSQEDCVTVDTSTWDQREKNHMKANAYSLIFGSGHNIVPKVSGNQVCTEYLPIALSTIITTATLHAEHLDQETKRAAAAAKLQNDISLLEAEISSLRADVDTALSDWATSTAVDRIEALRKSMRLHRAEDKLESIR